MDGMNPYESAEQAFRREQEAAAKSNAKNSKKKRSKMVWGIILLVFGLLFLLAGAVVTFGSDIFSSMEDAEPVDIYEAYETEQYAYTYIQYMTEPVAYYDAMESMQFYISLDCDWNPVVVCFHDDDLEIYQPYIDWLYSDSYENEPEEIEVSGYAQPFDDELKQWVIEGFAENFGEDIVEESNFEEYFGEYYLQIGQKSDVYGYATAGIIFLLLGSALTVIGIVLLCGEPKIAVENNGPIIEGNSNVALGILGAFGGAVIGGLLWIVVGLMGYVSGWVAIAMMVFAYYGYRLLGHREDAMGRVISFVSCLITILPATYITWVWSYYEMVNEDLVGYTSFGRAIQEMSGYMSSSEMWGSFAGDIIIGYVFAAIMGIRWLASNRKKKNV